LLEAEGNTLVGLVDAEHLSLDRITFFDEFGGVGRFPGPGHVGHVDHAVDAFLEFDKGAVSRGVADDALDGAADRVTEMDLFPRIGLQVADGQGELLLLLADTDDDGFHLLGFLQNVAGAGDATGPG